MILTKQARLVIPCPHCGHVTAIALGTLEAPSHALLAEPSPLAATRARRTRDARGICTHGCGCMVFRAKRDRGAKIPYCTCGHPKAWHRDKSNANGAAAPSSRPASSPATASDAAPPSDSAGELEAIARAHPLGGAARKVLAQAVQQARALTRLQLAILSGYHERSKGFINALGSLRTAGLLAGPNVRLVATDAGRTVCGPVERLPPAGAQLREFWSARLSSSERRVFVALAFHYPREFENRTELGMRCTPPYHERSKGFLNALGRLRTLELCERDRLRASPSLFESGAAFGATSA